MIILRRKGVRGVAILTLLILLTSIEFKFLNANYHKLSLIGNIKCMNFQFSIFNFILVRFLTSIIVTVLLMWGMHIDGGI